CAFTYYCIYNSYIYIFIIFTYCLFFYIFSISLSYTLYLKFFPLMWTPYGASKVPFY
ncbi:unnamed protein product, partial [Brassica rapa subsp. trilocularis]